MSDLYETPTDDDNGDEGGDEGGDEDEGSTE
jgi:hypothetical protein